MEAAKRILFFLNRGELKKMIITQMGGSEKKARQILNYIIYHPSLTHPASFGEQESPMPHPASKN
jgi:hypothetical protein